MASRAQKVRVRGRYRMARCSHPARIRKIPRAHWTSEINVRSHVGYRGKTGRVVLTASFSHFGPKAEVEALHSSTQAISRELSLGQAVDGSKWNSPRG